MGDKGGNACKGNVFFSMHHVCCYAQVLGMKKPKSKIGRRSGIGKFCPPAAALPELMRGNKFEQLCYALEGGGGGCSQQNQQEGAINLEERSEGSPHRINVSV
jgi:hypothetical protein